MGFTLPLSGERLEVLKLGNSISIHTNGQTFCLDLMQAEQLRIGLSVVLGSPFYDRAQTEDMRESYRTPRSGLKTSASAAPSLEDI